MSDTVLIVLIVVAAVIVVLWMFRSSLSRFFIKANKEGMEAELQTHDNHEQNEGTPGERPDVNVRSNWQVGRGNKIRVSGKEADVSDNRQLGEDQDITIKDKKQRKKK